MMTMMMIKMMTAMNKVVELEMVMECRGWSD